MARVRALAALPFVLLCGCDVLGETAGWISAVRASRLVSFAHSRLSMRGTGDATHNSPSS
jgi:hypothetical protein